MNVTPGLVMLIYFISVNVHNSKDNEGYFGISFNLSCQYIYLNNLILNVISIE
jgi:hypothetical protein